MAEYDYDLFTIGAGSGGVRAARISATYGAKVGIAEDRYLGGTCVNVGCVPKKLLVYASHYAEDFEDAAGFGWTVGASKFSWPTLIANKNREIERLNGIYANLLGNAGVELHEGRATVVDPHTVSVNGKTLTAKYILVATGGWPDGSRFSRQGTRDHLQRGFLSWTICRNAPSIVGGGYIAVEFAGILQRAMAAHVTQLYRSDRCSCAAST